MSTERFIPIPSLLNVMADGEEGGTDLLAIYDADREQVFSIQLSRILGLSGGGVLIEDGGTPAGNATSLNFVGFTITDQGSGVFDVEAPEPGIGGSGTDNTIPLFNGTDAVENSIITQQSTTGVTVAGTLTAATFIQTTSTATTGTIRLAAGATITLFNATDVTYLRFNTTGGQGGIVDFGISTQSSFNMLNSSYMDFHETTVGSSHLGRIIPTGTNGNEGVQIAGLVRVQFNIGAATGTGQVVITDGKLSPVTDNDIDLGDNTHFFKNVFMKGALRMDNQESGAGVGAGTLANAPSAGDPDVWIPVNLGGTQHWIPAWAA